MLSKWKQGVIGKMNFALIYARKKHNLLQRDVAKELGIHHNTYYEKENGKKDFTIREARMLCKLFNCTMDELFMEDVS